MYTIYLNSTNALITTVKENIMQRSSLVDNLHFLVEPEYKDEDMSEYTVVLEYLLPVSKEYKTIILEQSDELYKDCLEYTLPLGTDLTKEAGSIEVMLTFAKTEMDDNGNIVCRVRKTQKGTIDIMPITNWSNYIPDEALTAIDQRIVKLEAVANALDTLNQEIYDTKADNITMDEDGLHLTANGDKVGTPITSDVLATYIATEANESNHSGIVTTVEF